MVTLVGTQNNIIDALKDLLELEYDAVEAYSTAIDNLETKSYKDKLIEFKEDHQQHIASLTQLIEKNGEKAPSSPSGKQWLTKGKVMIADLIGDTTILRAMRSNELDTNKAYETMLNREDHTGDSKEIIRRGLEDEIKHKNWLEETIKDA